MRVSFVPIIIICPLSKWNLFKIMKRCCKKFNSCFPSFFPSLFLSFRVLVSLSRVVERHYCCSCFVLDRIPLTPGPNIINFFSSFYFFFSHLTRLTPYQFQQISTLSNTRNIGLFVFSMIQFQPTSFALQVNQKNVS